MMHTSRLFGDFTYNEDQIITFPEGLLGFPDFKRFVLKANPETLPVHWLLSVDENGPELAVVNPADISPDYDLGKIPLTAAQRRVLNSAGSSDKLETYAVVTLPENIKQMSMNLRTPILIDMTSLRGLQLPAPGLNKKPVRALIYRDLIFSRPEDKSSMLVIKRKINETVEIGDEISVQVMEFGDGGVKLGINAPRSTHVSRGEYLVAPRFENLRANEAMNLKRLEGIMSMHNVMKDPEGHMEGTAHPIEEKPAAV